MKALATLIKLQKSLVDEQRQQLAKLQDMLDEIGNRIAQLEIERAREQLAAEQSPEARATYGAFLRQVIVRATQLEQEREVMSHAVDAAHAKLAELFEEQKRYEVAEQARIDEEAEAERHEERLQLDEIGSISFERQKNK